MARILREAEQEKINELVNDIHIILVKVKEVMDRDDVSDEEKEKMKNEIIDPKLDELKQLIELYKGKSMGKAWDFSAEKSMDVFTKDDVLILRGYREEDNGYIRQIKKENSSSPNEYDDDKVWEFSSNWLIDEKSFVCSIIREDDNQYIGYISIKNSSSNLWEIAIELLEKQCNKGYGTRALALFLPAISKATGKTQFQALVETDNIPSQKLMEKLGARLIDIYDYTFNGDEDEAEAFEEKHLDKITDRMIELAEQIDVESRKMLSHVLDYRFFIEEGKIANKRR